MGLRLGRREGVRASPIHERFSFGTTDAAPQGAAGPMPQLPRSARWPLVLHVVSCAGLVVMVITCWEV